MHKSLSSDSYMWETNTMCVGPDGNVPAMFLEHVFHSTVKQTKLIYLSGPSVLPGVWPGPSFPSNDLRW